MSSSIRAAVLGFAAATAIGSGAQAQSMCAGVLRASLVHKLPTPLTVGTARNISDTANPELTRRFAEGLRKAGLTLAEQASTTLAIAVSVTAAAGSRGVTSGTYKGFEWMSGQPAATAAPSPGIRSATLSISAILTDNAATAQSWVGTLDCRVQTSDPGALAEFIGRSLGSVIGKDIDRKVI
ncbi:MAG: hypothetical protein WDN25_15540 [Acetobacteraceae bacterium]